MHMDSRLFAGEEEQAELCVALHGRGHARTLADAALAAGISAEPASATGAHAVLFTHRRGKGRPYSITLVACSISE